MIKDISELLKGFMDQEKKKLDSYSLNHAPTIGTMYEGLTSKILKRAIPSDLNLHITSGIIHDGNGNMSGQIDCMLVKGLGEEIPHTNTHKCHIKDVIAVFEVKKSLYSKDLKDSFDHLRGVLDNHSTYIQSQKLEGKDLYNINPARKAFSETTGIIPPPHAEVSGMGIENEIFYSSFITEQVSPIRIVVGYHGFKSETNLRKALVDFVGERTPDEKGYGATSFPQLIICGEYSLLKMNGFPYSVPMTSDHWDFYVSGRSNPVLLILEYIWTRLSREQKLGGLWGDDLTLENFNPLLSAKPVKQENKLGWTFKYIKLDEKDLSTRETFSSWEPEFVTVTQFVIFQRLCNEEFIDTLDQSFIDFITADNQKTEDFIKTLVQTGLVALNSSKLELTTIECACVILPDGYAVAENNSGRFTRWVDNRIKKNKKA